MVTKRETETNEPSRILLEKGDKDLYIIEE